jgi:tetratricopeptide (TPR) repeat protein
MNKRTSKKKPGIFSKRDAKRHFLFSRSAQERKIRSDEEQTTDGSAHMSGVPPEVLSGDAFVEHAMQQIKAVSCLSALIVKMDDPDEDKKEVPETDEAATPQNVIKIIDAICKSENGLWGQLDTGRFGCFFPGKNHTESMDLSRSIKDSILEGNNGTVSIGVAAFPMIDYEPEDLIANAEKALAHAAFFGPGSTVLFDDVSLNISGDEFYQAGDVAAAVKEFQRAIRLNPNNVNVHNSLGVCYGVEGALEEALKAFETAIAIDPQDVMSLYNAGYVYQLMGRQKAALDYLLKADAIGEEVFEVAFQIGKLYLEMADPENGKAFLEKAVAGKPESGAAYFHLGECYETVGMTEKAIVAYETAVKKNPNDAGALSALGFLYDAKAENPEISMLFCENSVKLSPENGLFQYRLGTVYFNNQQFSKALHAFEEAVRCGHPAASDIEAVQQKMAD